MTSLRYIDNKGIPTNTYPANPNGSLDGANAIMKGYEVFYNFIREHQAINCCPYELATDIKLEGNKWLGLIEMRD